MTTLRQAIADNLILDPETGEWSPPWRALPVGEVFVYEVDEAIHKSGQSRPMWSHTQKEKTDHE